MKIAGSRWILLWIGSGCVGPGFDWCHEPEDEFGPGAPRHSGLLLPSPGKYAQETLEPRAPPAIPHGGCHDGRAILALLWARSPRQEDPRLPDYPRPEGEAHQRDPHLGHADG